MPCKVFGVIAAAFVRGIAELLRSEGAKTLENKTLGGKHLKTKIVLNNNRAILYFVA